MTLQTIIKKIVTTPLSEKERLHAENVKLRDEAARFLDREIALQAEIIRLKGQVAGRDRIPAAYRRDASGRFV